MSILDVFGDTKELLRQASGGPEKVGIGVLSKESEEDQVVGIYFSAHWCPPCRAFTPQLAEWYKKFKETSPSKDRFEIIFVSSDREEASFDEYYKEMPWLALPYSAREVKGKLSTKYKVSGIPTLVFLDGKTGKIITKDGRSIVSDDPDGSEFPWCPPSATDTLASGSLLYQEKTTKWSDVTEDVIGLYFSASWCGPCRAFTPQLIETYEKVRRDNKSFQIIFVSSDRDEESFKEYYAKMPWLAIPFGDKRKKILSSRFSVSGIPTLVLVKKTGELITTKGRDMVSSDSDGKEFPWIPKPVNPLTQETASDVNENPSLIYFIKDGENGKEIRDALEVIAKTHIESNPEERVCFFYQSLEEDEDDIGSKLKEFVKALPDHNLLVVNVPAQKAFSTQANGVADLKEVWGKLEAGTLAMRPLSN